MCKHSKQTVVDLSKRQRGLDARGNDPMATKRESSWATDMIQNPPGDLLPLARGYMDGLVGRKAVAPAAKKLETALGNLPQNAGGTEFAELLLKKESGFKTAMDEIGNDIGRRRPELKAVGRNQPYFKDRGRNEGVPRARRNSVSNRDAGITTGPDRTGDTRQVFATDVTHAKGNLRGYMDSDTFKKFQESGAPFIGGASGTVQMVAMEMEDTKPLKTLSAQELASREKVLAMMSAQLVAGGHHSMAECLLASKAYGYFKNVPDPLTDYDGAMRALEKHLQTLGAAGGAPLSRETEISGQSKAQTDYDDRRAAVVARFARFNDQMPANARRNVQTSLDIAEAAAGLDVPNFMTANKRLDLADNQIKAQAELITAAARGNNHVLTPDELVQKMGAAPKTGNKNSLEYKAVQAALADYEKSVAELDGRKLDHDAAALAFEELRANLAVAQKHAKEYSAKHPSKGKKARRGVMDDLVARLNAEMDLLSRAEAKDANYSGELTIGAAVEFTRLGIDTATMARPDVLKESRIDRGASNFSFGSGAVNKVAKIQYAADGVHPAETRIFKAEKEKETALPMAATLIGIDKDDPRNGKRNIASGKFAAAAGLGAMLPTAEFTTVDGKVGLSMPLAKGKSVITKEFEPFTNPAAKESKIMAAYAARDQGDVNWKAMLPEKDAMGCGYRYEDNACTTVSKEVIKARALPLEAPPAAAADVAAVQKQLMDLQWLDALCGQVDRHAENYMIDTSGGTPVLTAIDNDMAFGKDHKDPSKTSIGNNLGLPPLIDRATFDTMKAMDWVALAGGMAGLLSVEEIAAAKARFDAVQAKLDDLDATGCVVDDWQTFAKDGKSATESLMDDDEDAPPSYYKRDLKTQRGLTAKGLTAA